MPAFQTKLAKELFKNNIKITKWISNNYAENNVCGNKDYTEAASKQQETHWIKYLKKHH